MTDPKLNRKVDGLLGEDGVAQRRHTFKMGPTVALDLEVPGEIQEEDDLALLQDDEFLQAKGEDAKLWFQVRRIKKHTCQCFGITSGLWLASLIALVICSIAIGSIEFDIVIPFYDRAEINQEREDSYLATERDADFVATFFASTDGRTECVHRDPTVLTRNGTLLEGPAPTANCQRASDQLLRVLYISSDRTSNILTSENLEQIRKIEEGFLNHLELSRYCQLIPSNYTAFTTRDPDEILAGLDASVGATEFNHVACARINSALNFMDDLHFDPQTGLGYYLIPGDVVPQEYDLTQSNINRVANYWANYTTTTYDISDIPAAVQQVGNEVTVTNLFHSVTSTDYQAGATEAIGLVSTFALGLPIDGYQSSSQDTTDQYEDVGTWLWEEFDEYLKSAGFDGVDVYFNDSENAMRDAETGALAIQSFALFPASIIFVFIYLSYMQDSFFVGFMGIMQILMSFIPGLVLYRYVFSVEYVGILNLIAIYIILGIGVDNIFVFCDQWNHHASEKRFGQRMQKTYNKASRAQFNTSCTTFISFLSNASSVFPAVSTFGIFAAVMVFVNFCAVTMFFPTAYGIYFKFIRPKWWDHPSRLFCCRKEAWTQDVYVASDAESERTNGNRSTSNDDEEEEEEMAENTENHSDTSNEKSVPEELPLPPENPNKIVEFFEKKWAPLVIKLRYSILAFFVAVLVGAIILATQLEPDEALPNTLPDDNQYVEYTDVLLEHFARVGNPEAIEIRWVSGINPDSPIDRSGTDDTDTSDYGTSNYVDCEFFNPTTPEAQVWNLQTCQDLFFGNVTEYHGDSEDFTKDGKYGPQARKIVTNRVPFTEEGYYQLVSCPHQGFRDWLLTDYGCGELQQLGLPCHNETKTRPNCKNWDVNGNSCEPYPVPSENFNQLFEAFVLDPNVDATTRQTNYDKYFRQLFVAEIPDLDQRTTEQILQADFSCRTGAERVFVGVSSIATLDQTFEQNFEDGIDLYELWDEWSIQMRNAGPREVSGTMQASNGAWSYYFLNETLLNETFSGIALALGLSFLVLSIVGGNPIMAMYSVLTIALIVIDIFAFTVLMGWSLGVLEAVNYVVVIGLSIDYTVHLSEAYTSSHATERQQRVVLMVGEMGISVLSGALSTLGAVFFMFFAPNTFFVKFAAFIFATITLSCIYSLTFFPAFLAVFGPTGDFGNVGYWLAKKSRERKHRKTVEYLETEEFARRELATRIRT